MHLNTELRFVVETPGLASRLQDVLETLIPRRAYEVILDDGGDLGWIERNGDRELRHDTEPGATSLQRSGIAMWARLPIEWHL